jgi:hypothetical protein
MPETAEVLQLLYGARDRFQLIHAQVRSWRDYDRIREYHRYRRTIRVSEKRLSFATADPGPPPEEVRETGQTEMRTDVWIAKPWKVRLSQARIEDGQIVPTLLAAIKLLDTCWVVDADGNRMSNENQPRSRVWSLGPEFLFDPARLLASIALETAQKDSWIGRQATTVLASPRPGAPRFGVQGLGEGDDYLLTVDREYGVLLRAATRVSGQEVVRHEVETLDFAPEAPADLFVPSTLAQLGR